jgi:phosphoglycerate dehydrogenase-like enzyme
VAVPRRRLHGPTLGLLGFDRIGQEVVRVLSGERSRCPVNEIAL